MFNKYKLLILALIFSFALMFVFIELPVVLDSFLQNKIGFPGFDHGISEFDKYKSDLFINNLYLRWIGYASLLLIACFIVIGFTTKKSGWAWAGAFGLFLPVFGQFALSMFFLAGLGILRVSWLPFMDISFNVLQLGDIIYLPYWILMWSAGLFNWNAHLFLSYLFMSAGAFLFVLGVLVWLQTRFGEKRIAAKSIYKFSRHPQYIGWIIWSYGLMLFSANINNMKKTWSISSSLPWLLAVMVIIGICLIEEIKMKEENGEKYESYRKKTPFLFPLPKWIKTLINAPINLLLRKDSPSTKMQAVGITSFYTVILILLSLFWVDFETKQQPQHAITYSNPYYQIDSLLNEIRITPRRYLHKPFNGLKNLGSISVQPLTKLLSDSNEVIREFAADALGDLNAASSENRLIELLNDVNARVRKSAAVALGKLKSEKALDTFNNDLIKSSGPGMRYAIYTALGKIGTNKAWNILLTCADDSVWFSRISAINALCSIDSERAAEVIGKSLSDKNPNVRRNSVFLILKYKIKSLKRNVSMLINDEDFETRFYSRIILEGEI